MHVCHSAGCLKEMFFKNGQKIRPKLIFSPAECDDQSSQMKWPSPAKWGSKLGFFLKFSKKEPNTQQIRAWIFEAETHGPDSGLTDQFYVLSVCQSI